MKVEQYEDDQIIIITIGDDFVEQSKTMFDRLEKMVSKWDLEWGLVADYRGVSIKMTPEYLNALITAMRRLRDFGVGKVVRVLTPEQAMFQPVLKLKSKEFANYEGIAVKTIEDAIYIHRMTY